MQPRKKTAAPPPQATKPAVRPIPQAAPETAPQTPPQAQQRTPADDVLELEDIVSTLQTQDPEPAATDDPFAACEPQASFAPAASTPEVSSPTPGPCPEPPADEYAAACPPRNDRPAARLEYRTSGARWHTDPFTDLEPFFTKTTLVQAGLGALLLMLVFLAGVYVGSTSPKREPEAPAVVLQPQVELLSTAAVRDLGPQPADFGPQQIARVMIRFIVEQSGREVYVLKYSRGGEPSLFTVDFPNKTIMHKEGSVGSGLILTWKGFVLERLRAAAQGQNLEMTPQGEIPASLQRF